MHSQALHGVVRGNAHRVVFGAASSRPARCRLQQQQHNRHIAKAVEAQQSTPTELAPLPWTGSEQQQQVGRKHTSILESVSAEGLVQPDALTMMWHHKQSTHMSLFSTHTHCNCRRCSSCSLACRKVLGTCPQKTPCSGSCGTGAPMHWGFWGQSLLQTRKLLVSCFISHHAASSPRHTHRCTLIHTHDYCLSAKVCAHARCCCHRVFAPPPPSPHRYFDVEEAEQKLRSMMAWRKRFRWAQHRWTAH